MRAEEDPCARSPNQPAAPLALIILYFIFFLVSVHYIDEADSRPKNFFGVRCKLLGILKR